MQNGNCPPNMNTSTTIFEMDPNTGATVAQYGPYTSNGVPAQPGNVLAVFGTAAGSTFDFSGVGQNRYYFTNQLLDPGISCNSSTVIFYAGAPSPSPAPSAATTPSPSSTAPPSYTPIPTGVSYRQIVFGQQVNMTFSPSNPSNYFFLTLPAGGSTYETFMHVSTESLSK
jgi:hypothetical protein